MLKWLITGKAGWVLGCLGLGALMAAEAAETDREWRTASGRCIRAWLVAG